MCGNFKSTHEKHTFYTIMKQRLFYGFLLLLVCLTGSMRTWALEQDANGVYQIGTAQDLIDFAAFVNQGVANMSANAVLTNDIDMTGQPWDNAIGNWASGVEGYKGHFDGQNHAISGLEYTTTKNYHGLFGVLLDGAVVENFSVYGNITNVSYDAIAVIAYSKNDVTPVYIRNIHSYLNLTTSGSDKKVGGVLGNGNNGTTYVDRCIFSGSIKTTNKTNCGGIVAYIQNNSSVYVNITNCIFDGKLESENSSTYCGGILGYIGANSNRYTVKNCLSVGTVTAPIAGSIFGYVRNEGGGFGNNYYLGTTTSGKTEGTGANNVATPVTAEQLKSGEICYKLNGDNLDDIAFYQNIDEDEFPVLDSTHKRVYAVGERLCDGSFSGEVAYTNDSNGEGTIPDHDFDEGYCSVCGAMDMTYMKPVDGWYEIGTARQLRWFADFVNAGNYDINAKVVDDLNLSYEEYIPVIGNSPSNAYKGIFDGQGHELNSYFLNVSSFAGGYGYGLFGNTSGATIKDFSIDGELTFENGGAAPSSDAGCGLIGWPDGGTLIQNIKNNVDIFANISTHVGGMVGSLRNATIDRCEYLGRINGLSSKNGVAGIAGYTNTGTITNCIFSGIVEGDGTGYFAGILGYVNNGSAKVKGCLSVGRIDNEVSSYVAAVVGRLRNISTDYADNYYTGEIKGIGGGEASQYDYVVANTTSVTYEQVASGEVAWGLNGGTYVIPAFYQTIGQDEVPVWDATHDLVYPTVDGYSSMPMDDSMDNFLDDFAELQQAKTEETVACQQLIDNYLAAIVPLADVDTYEEFVEAYAKVKPLLDSIQVSEGYYKAYADVCSGVADYMDKNDVGGKEFVLLNNYLTTDEEPSEEFPNGTYLYILRTHLLTNEQIEAEAKDVDARLQAAIANNYIENTDITSMLVNPTFADGTTGWDTTVKPTVATVGSNTAAEITKTFTIIQTLTGLKNGIYLLGANAAQRAGSDIASQYYAARLTANDNMNYIQVPGEDYAEEKTATDDKEYTVGQDVLGYVPATANGFTYAMEAGRYQNYTAVRVTDGQLTVGVENPGTGIGSDQVLVGGLRLVYLGKGDTLCEGLDVVLESYRKRAQVIIDFVSSDGADYAQYPNISTELKDALQECSDGIAKASTGDEKMALVDRFSSLMKDVYDCRKAYIEMVKLSDEMYDMADNLYCSRAITDQMQNDMYDLADAAQDAFMKGSYSTEEAKNAVKAMREYGNLVPPTDEDGTYLLGTPLQLAVFAVKVTTGEVKANAKLVADIDLKDLEWQAIGAHGTYGKIDTATPYEGTFDGQGHKITNFTISDSGDSYNGLFACVSGTIKNFSISGNLSTTEADFVGVVGQVKGGVMENVHSSVNIVSGSGSKHIGGVVGAATNSAEIIGCSYSGTLDIGVNGDSFAGIVGYAGDMTMKDCLFDGVIEGNEGNEASYVGGLIGYANTTGVGLLYNLSVGKVSLVNASAISGTFRAKAPSLYICNYWLEGSASHDFGTNEGVNMPAIAANTFVVTPEKMASGEVCYALNNNDEAYFYQTIGQDAYPVLDATHAVVYPVGEFTCDGRPKGELGYSNDANGYKRDEHDFVDGACTVCHQTPDGYFGIKTAEELRTFAERVNAGEYNLNAKLVKDIDLSETITEANPWTAAGTWASEGIGYKGHFDGQGHTISGFNATSNRNYFGIFGVLSIGAVVENFTIYGNVVLNHKTGGVIGYSRDASPIIRNIHSYLNITSMANGNRPGGIIGTISNGTTTIENCTYSGTINCGGRTGNYGGIVGYVNSSTETILFVTNCLFEGEIQNGTVAEGQCGGIIGYNNAGKATVKNCLSVGTLTSLDGNVGQIFGRLAGNNSVVENNYYLGEFAYGTSSAGKASGSAPVAVTDAQLASGEVCYDLNADNQEENSVWFQTIGADAYPVLDKTHKIVIYDALNGYHNLTKDEEDGINSLTPALSEGEGAIYNLAGQRISRLQKGINIIGGKKVLF